MSIKEYEVLDGKGLSQMLEYLLVNLGPKIVTPSTLQKVADQLRSQVDTVASETNTKVSQEVFDACNKEVQDLIKQFAEFGIRLDDVEPTLDAVKQRVDVIEPKVDTIKAQYEQISPKVAEIQDRLTNTVKPGLEVINAGIRNLNKDLDATNEAAAALTDRVDIVEENIDQTKDKLSEVELKVADNATKIAENKAELAQHELKLTQLGQNQEATSTDLQQLQTTVSEHGTSLEAVKNQVSELEDTLAEIVENGGGSGSVEEGVISGINERLDALTEADAAHDAKFSEVDGKIVGIEEKVTGVDSKLTGIDEKVTGIDEKVTSVDEKVTGVDEKLVAVDEKLSNADTKFTEIDTKFTGVDTKFTEIDAKITELTETAGEITDEEILKLEERITQLRTDFDNLGIKIENIYVTKDTFNAVIDLLKAMIGSGNVGGGGTGGGTGGGIDPDLMEGYVTLTTFNNTINGLKDRITTLEDAQLEIPENGFVSKDEFDRVINQLLGNDEDDPGTTDPENPDPGEEGGEPTDPDNPGTKPGEGEGEGGETGEGGEGGGTTEPDPPVVTPPEELPEDPSDVPMTPPTNLRDAVSRKTFNDTVSVLENQIEDLQNRNSVLEGTSAKQMIEINILKATITEMKAMIEEIMEYGSIPPASERPNIVGIENAIFTIEDGRLLLIHPDDELAMAFYIDDNGHLQMCYNSVAPDIHIDENGHLILVYDENDPGTTGADDTKSIGTPVEEASFTLSPNGNLAVTYNGEEMEVQPYVDEDGHLKLICNNDSAKLVINHEGRLLAIT